MKISDIKTFIFPILGITEKEGKIKMSVCRNCGIVDFPERIRKGGSLGKFFEALLWILWIILFGTLFIVFIVEFDFFSFLFALIVSAVTVWFPIGFTVWRNAYRYGVCRACGKKDLVPLDSPAGQKLQKQFGKSE